MSYVEIRDYGDRKHTDAVDRAIKELKRKMKKEEIFQELKRREFYMSPSKKKRFRKNEAFKRRKREEKKQEWYGKRVKSSPANTSDQFDDLKT